MGETGTGYTGEISPGNLRRVPRQGAIGNDLLCRYAGPELARKRKERRDMMREVIGKVVAGKNLAADEAARAVRAVMEGKATPAQIGGFLTALRVKGETMEEIYGAALAMREKAVPICRGRKGLLDTCGTGGDGSNTFNISTTAAFILAAAGVPVAKHGNRAISSACGSADLLEALGIKVDLTPRQVEAAVEEVGIGFLFAPLFHQAMKYAAGPRKELGFRTVFNLLGPLTNPAGADYQLAGVFRRELLPVLAEVLARLGVKRALVVHGAGGIDELSLAGENFLCEVAGGRIRSYTLHPEEVGLPYSPVEQLKGGSAQENAGIFRAVLSGEKGPRRAVVLLNAGAALYVAGRADTIRDGVKLAAEIIDSGAALAKMEALAAFSRKEQALCI